MVRLLKKICHRLWRILSGRKGVYCKCGKGNKFCKDVFLHEMSEIGSYNYIGYRTMTLNAKIGNYCSIASDVKIGQMEHDLKCVSTNTHIFGPKHGITEHSGYIEPAIIGNDVWIAANCVIKQGVKIGDGAVIGAGAVVIRDVEPYEIVAGVPAKHIRYRFDEETAKMITNEKWWDLQPNDAVKVCQQIQKKIDGDL